MKLEHSDLRVALIAIAKNIKKEFPKVKINKHGLSIVSVYRAGQSSIDFTWDDFVSYLDRS